MTLEPMTPAQHLLLQSRLELESTHRRLVSKASRLIDVLARAKTSLETNGTAASLNALGELQSSATEFDLLCAVFGAQQSMVEKLETLSTK